MREKIIFIGLLVFFFSLSSPLVALAQVDKAVFNLIQNVQADLVQANKLLNEIETTGLVSTVGSDLVVSVAEIRNKVTLAQDFLNRAISSFEIENYELALVQVKLAEANSRLSVYYLGALLNHPSSFNISQLFLQGDILDLLSLKSVFRINELTTRLAEILPVLNNNNQSADINSAPAVFSPPTALELFTRCLTDNETICQNQLSSCLIKQKAPVSTCQLDFVNRQARCNRLADRAGSRLATCEIKKNECLRAAAGSRGVTACNKRFNACAAAAERQVKRDNRLAEFCQQRVDRDINSCQKRYLKNQAKFEQATFACFDTNNLCLVRVENACNSN